MDYLAVARRALEEMRQTDVEESQTCEEMRNKSCDGAPGLLALLIRYRFRQHPCDGPLAVAAPGEYIGADLDAVCDCGRPASHLTAHGLWQCSQCAGQGEALEPASEAERRYDELRRRWCQALGCAGRARRAGDLAAADALGFYAEDLGRQYAEARANL